MDVKSRHLEGAHGHIFFRNKVSSNSRWHRRSDETFTVLWRLWQGLPVARCQTKQKLKVVGDGRGHFLRKDSCQWSEKSTWYDMMIVTPLSTQGRGRVQGKPQWRCKSGWPSCRCPRKWKSTPLKMVELQTNQCQNSFWGYLMTVLFLLPLRIVSLITVHYKMKISISKKLLMERYSAPQVEPDCREFTNRKLQLQLLSWPRGGRKKSTQRCSVPFN